MDKSQILQRVRDLGILAVIRGPSPELTLKTVDALVTGGVYGIEITYSTPKAAQVVRILREKYGEEILLGMGTLTTPEQVEEAKVAGACFIVSPHFDAELVKEMISSDLVVMIGALTPSEVVQVYRMGSDIVKIFPASLGGPSYLKALRGPLPEIPMMPTGGVSPDNVEDWFDAGAVAIGAGSALCPSQWVREGRFSDITKRASDFVALVQEARAKDEK